IIVRPGAGEPNATGDDPSNQSGQTDEPTTPPSTPALAEGEPCEPSALQVIAQTDQARYDEGQKPKQSLSVKHLGTVSCTIDGGTATQVFTITSGEDTYWTSTDCQRNAESATVLLDAGQTVSTEQLAWDRTRSSSETCD